MIPYTKAGVYTASFSADGSHFASARFDGTVQLWNGNTLESRGVLNHTDATHRSVFAPNAKWIAVATDKGAIYVWDLDNGKPDYRLLGQAGKYCDLAVSKDNQTLYSASADQTLRAWDFKQGEQRKTTITTESKLTCLAISPDETLIAIGTEMGQIVIVDSKLMRQIHEFREHWGRVQCVCFSPNGNLLASASGDGTVKLWDVEKIKTKNINQNVTGRAVLPKLSDDEIKKILQPVMQDAIVYYNFDIPNIRFDRQKQKTTMADLSRFNNEGILAKAVGSPGIVHHGRRFNGKDSEISIPTLRGHLVKNHKQLTVSLWCKEIAPTYNAGVLFDVGHLAESSVSLFLTPEGLARFAICEKAGGTVVKVPRNPNKSWRHLLGTWDGKNASVYIDGKLAGKAPTKQFVINEAALGPESARLGCQAKEHSREQRRFIGDLDEFFIIPKAVTAEQAQLIYELGKNGKMVKDYVNFHSSDN